MAREFGGKARFVSENYGDSELARRYGVTRYPAIFVDEVLFATPKEFGFYGKGEGTGTGRYTPLRSAETHERLQSDLRRMVTLVLEGREDLARADSPSLTDERGADLPAFTLTDLAGRRITRSSLAGKPVLVEFWATWCPPCRATLAWLGDLKARRGDGLEVLALAVQSDEEEVRKLTERLRLPLVWALADSELVRTFGDISAVPTLQLFDGQGRARASFFGAPPDLHERVEAALDDLL